MGKAIIWHNPRCRKSREGLQYLQQKNVEIEIFDYMKEGFQPEQLVQVIEMSGEPVEAFIRTNEREYRELGLKGKALTAQEFAEIASKHPRLLQRPIVIYKNKAVLARPADKIDQLFM